MEKEISNRKKIRKSRIIFKFFLLLIFFKFYILNFKKIYNIGKNLNIKNEQSDNNLSIYNRIFLCSLYNNEAEMAYIHVWRLYNYVDKFIFVVSNVTHSGHAKNISFEPFWKKMRTFRDKIDIIYFDNICNINEYPNSDYNWCIEKSQRDYAKIYIEKKYNPTNNDILIVVDIDEILTREGIIYIKNHLPDDYKFIKGTYYFPYYYHRIIDWDRGYVIRYNKKMKSLSYYRQMNGNKNNIITFKNNPSKPLITHCSYCFKSITEYKNKLVSFAHQEYNKSPYITNNWIFKSHFCREIFNFTGYDEIYDGWTNLIPDDERLKYLIDRSFKYNINQTTYTEKDLETLCNIKYNRTPFELSAKYK